MHGISDRVRSQCKVIVEQTRLVTGAVRVVLLLYDETTRRLDPVTSMRSQLTLQQVASELIERNHPGLSPGHVSYGPNINKTVEAAFVGQRTQITPIAEALENIYPPSAIAVARGLAGVTHMVTCPVTWEGRCLGIVRFQVSGIPTDAQQALMEAAASQIGLTMANAELVEQMRRQLGAVQAVGEVARLAVTRGVMPMVRSLVERMRLIADADLAIVYLVEPGVERFHAAAACFADTGQQESGGSGDARLGYSRPFGEGLAGWVIAAGEAAFVQDDRLDPRVGARRPFAPPQAIIAVPMRVEGNTIGCLRLAVTGSRHFTEADLWLAQTLADEAAQAIDNTQRLERELAEVRSVGQAESVRLRQEVTLALDELEHTAPNDDEARHALQDAVRRLRIAIEQPVPNGHSDGSAPRQETAAPS